MPALRMKAKPTADLRGHSLHVCRKSIRVSKGSNLRTSQQSGILANNMPFFQDATPNFEFPNEFDKHSDIVDLRVCCKVSHDQPGDLTLGSSDVACDGRMMMQAPDSTTILETLFSPIIAYDDVPVKLTAEKETAVDGQAELPCLIAEDSDESSSRISNPQSCTESDCHISDQHFDISFDRGWKPPDVANTIADCDCLNTQMLANPEDKSINIPCYDGNLEAISLLDYSNDEAQVGIDDSYLLLAIHQVRPPVEGIKSSFHLSTTVEEVDCFDPHTFIRNLPDVTDEVSPHTNLLMAETRKKPVTLVLDLDETLVHSTLDHCEDADFTFPVLLNMKEHTVYVRQRPHLHIFLERVAEMFEIVIFTASQSIYAERLLDILDPNKKIISQRKYRESCTFSGGSYTKDLTILGVDLARVVIIDNSPQVFQLQVNNGIPIKSWFNDPLDCALISLLPFLETLAEADDVRPLIANKFSSEEEK